jgi:hypothetical protein
MKVWIQNRHDSKWHQSTPWQEFFYTEANNILAQLPMDFFYTNNRYILGPKQIENSLYEIIITSRSGIMQLYNNTTNSCQEMIGLN